jgi:hypothetical protein
MAERKVGRYRIVDRAVFDGWGNRVATVFDNDGQAVVEFIDIGEAFLSAADLKAIAAYLDERDGNGADPLQRFLQAYDDLVADTRVRLDAIGLGSSLVKMRDEEEEEGE